MHWLNFTLIENFILQLQLYLFQAERHLNKAVKYGMFVSQQKMLYLLIKRFYIALSIFIYWSMPQHW